MAQNKIRVVPKGWPHGKRDQALFWQLDALPFARIRYGFGRADATLCLTMHGGARTIPEMESSRPQEWSLVPSPRPHPVEWIVPRDLLSEEHPLLAELAMRFVTHLEGNPSVSAVGIRLRDEGDDVPAPYLSLDVWTDLGEARAFALSDRLDDVLEQLEDQLDLPVGESVVLVHWRSE